MPLAVCAMFDEGVVNKVYPMLERTTDAGLIRSVVMSPNVLPHVWDRPEAPPVPMSEQIYHLAARCQGELIGIVSFIPVNSITWNPHINMLVQGRGLGTDVMCAGSAWMFEHTACQKIVAFPPEFKTAMIRVFEKCGYVREGFSPASFQFNGAVCGRVLMGRSKYV